MIRPLQFIAIVLTALALIPSGAHVLELANKINLDHDSYITVQQIYRGWALLGSILILSVFANGLVAFKMRSHPAAMAWQSIAALLMCVGLMIFFAWTFPVNQVTSNWQVAPENWQSLRAQWEYSHAANAVVTFLALCSATVASLIWSRQTER
jgi:hypothetical protein